MKVWKPPSLCIFITDVDWKDATKGFVLPCTSSRTRSRKIDTSCWHTRTLCGTGNSHNTGWPIDSYARGPLQIIFSSTTRNTSPTSSEMATWQATYRAFQLIHTRSCSQVKQQQAQCSRSDGSLMEYKKRSHLRSFDSTTVTGIVYQQSLSVASQCTMQ